MRWIWVAVAVGVVAVAAYFGVKALQPKPAALAPAEPAAVVQEPPPPPPPAAARVEPPAPPPAEKPAPAPKKTAPKKAAPKRPKTELAKAAPPPPAEPEPVKAALAEPAPAAAPEPVIAEPVKPAPAPPPAEPPPPPVEVAKVAPPPPAPEPAAIVPAPQPAPLPAPEPLVEAPPPADVAPAAYPSDQTAMIAAAVFGDTEASQQPAAKLAPVVIHSPGLPQAMDRMAVEMTAGIPAGKSLAVASVVALDGASRDSAVDHITVEMLTTRAIQNGNVKIAEQAQVKRVMEELQMSSFGLTEERDMTKAGLVLGVDYVVAGTAHYEADETVLTFTKVETATGRAVAVWESRVPAVAAQTYLGDRVERRSRYDSLWRSAIMPGWGQFYNEQNVRGGIYVATAFTLVGLTAYQYGRFSLASDDYQSATSENESATAFSRAESMRTQAYLLIGVTAGFWVFNAVDAYFGGREEAVVKRERVAVGFSPLPGGVLAGARLHF